jgi:hypothetical protein
LSSGPAAAAAAAAAEAVWARCAPFKHTLFLAMDSITSAGIVFA